VPLAEPLYARAGADNGITAARGLIRATELRLARGDSPEKAREYMTRAKALRIEPGSSLGARIQALAAEVEAAIERSQPSIPVEQASSAGPELASLPPRIIPCRLVGLSGNEMTVDAGGQRRTMAITEVLAVAVGLLRVTRCLRTW
jgi:hypothetical protein